MRMLNRNVSIMIVAAHAATAMGHKHGYGRMRRSPPIPLQVLERPNVIGKLDKPPMETIIRPHVGRQSKRHKSWER